ncbi:MAG: neuraminidase-like domain-containing protein, partial [Mucilaginibacter sp.]
MKNNITAIAVSENGTTYKVYGTIRNVYQQPMPGATVRAYKKGLHGRKLLGEAITATDGTYAISYTLKNSNTAALRVGAYDAKNVLLKESGVHYEVPAELQADLDLSDKSLASIAQYDQLLNLLAPFTEDVPLAKMTETADKPNFSFITQKTGVTRQAVEMMAMTARFAAFSSLPAQVWYGILAQRMPPLDLVFTIRISPLEDFETRLDKTFDALMHTPVAALTEGLQQSIDANIIAYPVSADLVKISTQLSEQLLAYAKQHPVTGAQSLLHQKAELGGLKGAELQAFIKLKGSHTGTENDFWEQVQGTPALKKVKKPETVRAVFHIAKLTGNNLPLTEHLVKTQKIASVAGIKKLAGYDHHDWAALLKKHKITLDDTVPGKTKEEKVKNYATQLDSAFTGEYPAAAFAARLQKDTKSKLPHRDKVSEFLQKNEDFDLLNHHVGTFIKENKHAVPEKDAADVAHHMRRIQRVAKLTPTYDKAAVLLDDNIHSAHQVYKMGRDNFVKKYGKKLGAGEAEQIFQKAGTVHATALALASNLRSMSDASAMNAFPDFKAAITGTLSADLPDLDTLFGHTDYCDCSECNSVYGAPAYLTDILHYLDQRHSTLPPIGGKTPSVKDILLRRRPDIGDIDLQCDNTNTQVPYIDIACEIMEDYIAPPVILVVGTFLPLLVKGTIPPSLLTEIKARFVALALANVSNLLTNAAAISDPYTVKHLLEDNTYVTQTHWIIRDSQVALRATQFPPAVGTPNGYLEFRVLHQTLLSSDAISTGPEYINTHVYSNYINVAKTPFTLPFDLFETEGDLYLEKLGIKKTDLIDIFRKEDKALPGASTADIKMAYASLGVNEAEQILIFTADPAKQSLYWRTVAPIITIAVNVFEKLSGLNYAQVLNLVQLQFINPAKDTLIEHDDLSANTTTQRLTNLTPVKLDAMHRFIRLWRKTSLTMNELDAIIMSPFIGQGKIVSKLALQLQQFFALQQKLQLNAFQLLAFYQNIDTTHNLPDCLYNQMFQNSAITSPVSVNFSIAAATPGTLGIAEADKAVIAAVLQVSVNDVNALIASTVSRISFPALSVMYRLAQLAQSLGITVNDLLTLLKLIDANPFKDLQSTSLFIQKYNLLQASGFSIDELNYVLRHQDNSSHSLVPSASQVSTALIQLQNELLAVRVATQTAPDTNGLLLTKWLSDSVFKWDTGQLGRLLGILNTVDDTEYKQKLTDNSNFLLNLRMVYHDAVTTADLPALPLTTATPAVPIVFPSSIASQIAYDTDKKQLKLTGYMSPADKTVLLALNADVAYQTAVNALFTAAQQTDSSAANIFFAAAADITAALNNIPGSKTADRFAFFNNKLSPVYKKLQQQNVLIKDISNWFTIDKKVVTQLLTLVPAVYTDLTADNFVNKIVTPGDPARPYPVQFDRYQFVAKICFIAGRLKLTDADLGFLLGHAVDIGSLNLLTLPLAPVGTAVTTFPTFEAFINLLRFQQYYPAKITDPVNHITLSIYTILTDAISQGTLPGAALTTYTANLVTTLSLLTGWNAADLTSFIGLPTTGITLTLPADIKSVPVLMRLHLRFVMLQQLGIAAVDALAWTKDSLLAADTAKIKQVLKQRYNNSDWLQVSKPLQDTLREKKRDALIAYLLANPGTQTWHDTNDLYNYFLLDVEMCSCQPTSRIVQATNTVQLFVQRCFLSLENAIIIDSAVDSDWLQWQWMKNFRVWQANVKVFLYPENYIEPELLPGVIKSPFLAELENDLLQGEVTATNAEDAFQAYLEKLSNVARLEIKGSYYDDLSKTLHVFGRTFGGDPKVYYYRKFIKGRRWTPWIKVDLDINSEFIIPVVYNNRVYLFWAIITELANPIQQVNVPQAGQQAFDLKPPSKNWQIQLAYSEYKNGKWTPKK